MEVVVPRFCSLPAAGSVATERKTLEACWCSGHVAPGWWLVGSQEDAGIQFGLSSGTSQFVEFNSGSPMPTP